MIPVDVVLEAIEELRAGNPERAQFLLEQASEDLKQQTQQT